MSWSRFRGAVAPLRRPLVTADDLPSVADLVRVERPEEPMICLRPAAIEAAARRFKAAFSGAPLYAVKCNPEPAVLRAIRAGGVDKFDCASPAEIRLVRQMFGDTVSIHYMHPVKAPGAIREAWVQHAVRDFSLDSMDELAKILEVLDGQDLSELGLMIRLALPKGNSRYDLSGKFGALPDDAAALLQACRPLASKLGVAFHVGSQCLDPAAYRRAIDLAADIIEQSGVAIDRIDVGGGFPVAYPDMEPPHLGLFMAEIDGALERRGLDGLELWAEPGRALVAGGGSVVVQVQLRKGNALYVNDGVYGSLSDAGVPGFLFPTRAIPAEGRELTGDIVAFELFGPTCDSADHMRGPFHLPADIQRGDWIEIGQLGAYGACLRTAFNGFDRAQMVEVRDGAMLTTAGLDD